MFNYTLVSKPSFVFDENILKSIFENISKKIKKNQSGNINIVFLDSQEVRDLNKNYRGIDKTTDVLSFHYHENFKNFEKYDTVGEVVLNEEKIFSQALDYGITPEKEFFNLVIHSVLHILGYDHETDEDYKEMYSIESELWFEIFGEEKV
ncbi:rRNA maturation RNase YbeY [Candidatus Gracilibacteria bacterium]|nr:rRNA maturation RNase YbeY [Candidatus Gracilibacteria bacterium]